MKKGKRILAWILSVAMLVSSISCFSYAEEETADDTVQLAEDIEIQTDAPEILAEESLESEAEKIEEDFEIDLETETETETETVEDEAKPETETIEDETVNETEFEAAEPVSDEALEPEAEDYETNEIMNTSGNGKIDVWDFGAAAFDTDKYNNLLDADVINSWYPGVEAGSTGKNLPQTFTVGALSWSGGTGDRLRTTNTALTRFDENANSAPGIWSGDNIKGALYLNSANTPARGFTIALAEDDEVTLYVRSDAAAGEFTLTHQGSPEQIDHAYTEGSGTFAIINLVAKYTGTYKINVTDATSKPWYYRILRADAVYKKISGTVSAPGGLTGYEIAFTNAATGKQFTASVTGNSYEVTVPSGYDYNISLVNANGYIVSSNTNVTVSGDDVTQDITVVQVTLHTVTGAVSGLDAASLNRLGLTFTPLEERIFVPKAELTDDTYTVELEPNIDYTVTASDVNDYIIKEGATAKITGAATHNIVFETKPAYPVTLSIDGLSTEALNALVLTFNNLNEEGYSYTFNASDNNVNLRTGTYSVAYDGIDEYQNEMSLTSNLVVADAGATKSISFKKVYTWNFTDLRAKHIPGGKFKGLDLGQTGVSSNKDTYLLAQNGAAVKVPVTQGDKVTVGYCYSAAFNFNGETNVSSSSGSTSNHEFASYIYTGTDAGYVTLNVTGTTYFENISVWENVAYKSEITVNKDASGDYKTVNDALTAVSKMDRADGTGGQKRVTISIAPGNYEEMLVINLPNITLKNASPTPSIALKDKGAAIDENAVRITGYYGHGYNYYSMADNYKYDAETLAINKENGYVSKENPGAGGTTYWNATVTVSGSGFEAHGIIFENSFNQYISEKEANDILVERSDSKGQRSVTPYDTSVQSKSFVERAAAMAVLGDKAVFNCCRFVGRQDTLYGNKEMRAFFNQCYVMGGTDYIFGGMIAVFNRCKLVFNTSEASTDVGYITAAQQNSGRGYLMYNCTVTSTTPGIDTASEQSSKAGYFGRPWQPTTSEVAFVNTVVEESSTAGTSLIMPAGWLSSLGGKALVYEYNTTELTGEDNFADRADWSTILTQPKIGDVELVPFSFTNGSDGWDPYSDTGELGAPQNSKWDGYTAVWDVVTGAIGYTVQLYFNGVAKGDAVTTTENKYDFTSLISSAGKYIFKVFALSSSGASEDSADSYSAAKVVKITVFLAGDSTVSEHPDTYSTYDILRQGWGVQIGNFFNSSYAVINNLAISGRTSKTHLPSQADTKAQENYKTLFDNIKAGDYLFVQFGHNDEKDETIVLAGQTKTLAAGEKLAKNGTVTAQAGDTVTFTGDKDEVYTYTYLDASNVAKEGEIGSFKYYLYTYYAKPAIDKGATPVLCSPVVRRRFSSGVFNKEASLAAYGEASKELAAELSIPFIDLNEKTAQLYTKLGEEATKELHAKAVGADIDNTHFSGYGAYIVAGLVVEGINELNLQPLRTALVAGIPTMTPVETKPPATPSPEPTDEPSYGNGDKIWQFGDEGWANLVGQTVGTDSEYGYDLAYAGPGNSVEAVDTAAAPYTYEDLTFSHRFRLNGTPAKSGDLPTNKYFRFKVNGNSTITVYGISGGSGERFIMINNDVTKTEDTILTVTDNTKIYKNTYEYKGEGESTIYLYAKSSNIQMYRVEATNVVGSSEPDSATPEPTEIPTEVPTETPTETPGQLPTEVPSEIPTEAPTETPMGTPTEVPTAAPTANPTATPTAAPTKAPSSGGSSSGGGGGVVVGVTSNNTVTDTSKTDGQATKETNAQTTKDTLTAQNATVSVSQSGSSGKIYTVDIEMGEDAGKFEKAKVSIPYVPGEGESDVEKLVVFKINENGDKEAVTTAKYNPDTNTITFKAGEGSGDYEVGYAVKTFGDIQNKAWAKAPIEVLAAKGIIHGAAENTFLPDASVKRGDFMLMLIKTLGLSGTPSTNFKDVAKNSYYAEGLGIAKELGLANGDGTGNFNPETSISRQDMMVLTANALNAAGALNQSSGTAAVSKFNDSGNIKPYALNSVASLVSEGIVNGKGDSIDPDGTTTRAEAAVIIYNIFNKVN